MNHVLREDEPGSGQEVPVQTLDQVCAGRSPRLLKIDVEGYEAQVLDGGRHTLDDDALAALIVELNGSGRAYGVQDADVDRRLRSLGFLPHAYDPWERSLRELETWNTDVFNTIYLRDDALVRHRVLRAEPVQVSRRHRL